MGIFDLYSKRKKRERGEMSDVYAYDVLPKELKMQLVMIWQDAIGELGRTSDQYIPDGAFPSLLRILQKEYGSIFKQKKTDFYTFAEWFFAEQDIDKNLDAVELTCKCIDIYIRDNYNIWIPKPKSSPDDAISEINGRFQEAGVGYQYVSRKIIRVDSQIIHKEVVLPALNLLSEAEYKGANIEFLSAHEHYRKQEYEYCLDDCLKAFESVMKVVCHKKGWDYQATDTAKKLIDIIFSNNLIPQHHQSQFTALRGILESGIPTIRNKHGGHGRGVQTRVIPDYLAAYQLHQTAATILFLIQAEKNHPGTVES